MCGRDRASGPWYRGQEERWDAFAHPRSLRVPRSGAESEFGMPRAERLDDAAADQHEPGAELRQLDEIGQRKAFVGMQETQCEIARIASKDGRIVISKSALGGARDLRPLDRPARHRAPQGRAVGPGTHRRAPREHKNTEER